MDKPTIEELEKILNAEGESRVELLPNGEVVVHEELTRVREERDRLLRVLGWSEDWREKEVNYKDMLIRAAEHNTELESLYYRALGMEDMAVSRRTEKIVERLREVAERERNLGPDERVYGDGGFVALHAEADAIESRWPAGATGQGTPTSGAPTSPLPHKE